MLSPIQSLFCALECVEQLEAMMHGDPDASSWQLNISWAVGFGFEMHSGDFRKYRAEWRTTWATSSNAPATERLLLPGEHEAALKAFLTQLQTDHVQAVGGPLDGINFCVDVSQTESRLSVRV